MPESAPPSEPLRETVYTPESPMRHPGRLIAAMGKDLIASRELAWRLFVRDLSAMYRQSFLGYLWAFVPPVLAAAPWVFLNSQQIVSMGETAVPYPAFVLIGTMLWQTFIDALNSPLRQTNNARAMLAKINFPKEALLLAGIAETLWNMLIRMTLLIPLLWVFKVPFTASMALAPVAIGSLLLLGLGIGLLITPIGLLYTDVGRGIGIVAGFGMLLTPVIYPPPADGIGGWLARWNPISPVLGTARDWLTGQPAMYQSEFVWISAAAVALVVVTWFGYRLTLPILIERMGG